MGYQQSLVRFSSDEVLKEELIKYFKEGNREHARVYSVLRCVKEVEALDFSVGDLLVVVGGERYTQRSPYTLEEYLGLQNVEEVIFIDGDEIWHLSDGNIGEFLDEHLLIISEEEEKELLAE